MTRLPSQVTVVSDQLGAHALSFKHSHQGQLPGAQPLFVSSNFKAKCCLVSGMSGLTGFPLKFSRIPFPHLLLLR